MTRAGWNDGSSLPSGSSYTQPGITDWGGGNTYTVTHGTNPDGSPNGTTGFTQTNNPAQDDVSRYAGMASADQNRQGYQLDWTNANQDAQNAQGARGSQDDANAINLAQANGTDKTSANFQNGLLQTAGQQQQGAALTTGGADPLSQMSALQRQRAGAGAFQQRGQQNIQAQQANDMATGRSAYLSGLDTERQGDTAGQSLADQQQQQQSQADLAQTALNDQGQQFYSNMGVNTEQQALQGNQFDQAYATQVGRDQDAQGDASAARTAGLVGSVDGAAVNAIAPGAGTAVNQGIQSYSASQGSASDQSKGIPPTQTSDERAKDKKGDNWFVAQLRKEGDDGVQQHWDRDVAANASAKPASASLSGPTPRYGVPSAGAESYSRPARAVAPTASAPRKMTPDELIAQAEKYQQQLNANKAMLDDGPSVQERDHDGPAEAYDVKPASGGPMLNFKVDAATAGAASAPLTGPQVSGGAPKEPDSFWLSNQSHAASSTPGIYDRSMFHRDTDDLDAQFGGTQALHKGIQAEEQGRDEALQQARVDRANDFKKEGLHARRAGQPGDIMDPNIGNASYDLGFGSQRGDAEHGLGAPGSLDFARYGNRNDGMSKNSVDQKRNDRMDPYSKAIAFGSDRYNGKGGQTHFDDTSREAAMVSDERAKNKAETPEEKKARERAEDLKASEEFMKGSKPVDTSYEAYSRDQDNARAVEAERKRAAQAALDEHDAAWLAAKENAGAAARKAQEAPGTIGYYMSGRWMPAVDLLDRHLEKGADEQRAANQAKPAAERAAQARQTYKNDQQRDATFHNNDDLVPQAARGPLRELHGQPQPARAPNVPQSTGATLDVQPNGKFVPMPPSNRQLSDERAKDKKGDGIKNALLEMQKDANLKLKGETYTYKDGFGEDSSRVHHGFMAQNLEKNPITATAIREDGTGIKKVDKDDLARVTAAGVASLQEQHNDFERALAAMAKRRASGKVA